MTSPRITREKKTLTYMVKIYCTKHHGKPLCHQCQELLAYANTRLTKCPFQEGHKGSCNKCPKHCYKKAMRDKIKEVMRYSGPKMIWLHPILALLHLLDELKSR